MAKNAANKKEVIKGSTLEQPWTTVPYTEESVRKVNKFLALIGQPPKKFIPPDKPTPK